MLRLRKTPGDSKFTTGRHPMGPEWSRLLISEKEALGHLLRNKPEAQRPPHQPLPAHSERQAGPFLSQLNLHFLVNKQRRRCQL